MTTDLFEKQEKPKSGGNVPELSVAELAHAVQRSLEDTFGRVRVRGELSGLKLASSGHLYGDIKDADAIINVVCWRSTMPRLSIKPEDGMDVVITGKISSYPKSSRYQIVIEAMELAGQGALLKLLEDRKKKLAAEGLFDESRKKPLPYLPDVIGVVTSPTGAVIRDIMHRLDERFPRHVLLWPVAVQGDGAAQQIANAINGFNALPVHGPIPRPDIIIVARGGGSLEDLMAFNEEIVVRAAANSAIPLISAVGHETDTTLIDFAADKRAPTPTGAAEMAVPVRIDLLHWVVDAASRMTKAQNRKVSESKNILGRLSAQLGDPMTLLRHRQQTMDILSEKFSSLLRSYMQQKKSVYSLAAASLRPPISLIDRLKKDVSTHARDLEKAQQIYFSDRHRALQQSARLLQSLSFEKVLERGFVVVRDENGQVISQGASLRSQQDIMMQFHDRKDIKAKVE